MTPSRTGGSEDRASAPGIVIDLSGRTALVTGGAAGIGLAIVQTFAAAGADVIVVDRDATALDRVVASTPTAGGAITGHRIDLSERSAIDRLWDELADRPLDILVNNAGSYPGAALADVDDAFYERVRSVNLDSVVWMCRDFVRHRKGQGGVIVNIASIEAILPFKEDLAIYSLSKAGVIALTRALAREYAGSGMRANAVVPGGILTPGTTAQARDVLRGRLGLLKVGYDFRQRVPAGRLGKPQEVANVVLFLASDLASYMHGAVVPVDGGFLSS